MEKEIWKDIRGYTGYYQVSNFAHVKSLARTVIRTNGYPFPIKEKILKPGLSKGYLTINLCRNKQSKSTRIHKLVAKYFIPNPKHLPGVNHKNGIKTDNRVENLEWVSQRENITHAINSDKKSSKYTGVSWQKRSSKWRATITIKGKGQHLGLFTSEKTASIAFQNAMERNGIKNKYAII